MRHLCLFFPSGYTRSLPHWFFFFTWRLKSGLYYEWKGSHLSLSILHGKEWAQVNVECLCCLEFWFTQFQTFFHARDLHLLNVSSTDFWSWVYLNKKWPQSLIWWRKVTSAPYLVKPSSLPGELSLRRNPGERPHWTWQIFSWKILTNEGISWTLAKVNFHTRSTHQPAWGQKLRKPKKCWLSPKCPQDARKSWRIHWPFKI